MARASTSRPSITGGMACSWMGVGLAKPRSRTPRRRSEWRRNDSNDKALEPFCCAGDLSIGKRGVCREAAVLAAPDRARKDLQYRTLCAYHGRVLRTGEHVGEWVVEAPLGEGGMGAVYRVHSARPRRLVAALKVMKPTTEPDARARFVREAEALAALRHPAVVRVMGFNEDPERGLLYLVMELAVGETLRARMSRGPMALTEALATFVPLAAGLDHAHSEGIFHRDLKPANVVLTEDGTPRLVDFGIAAAREAEAPTTPRPLRPPPDPPPPGLPGGAAHAPPLDGYRVGPPIP